MNSPVITTARRAPRISLRHGRRLLFLCALFAGLAGTAPAQELEPRRWSHLPTGAHFAGTGYAFTKGDIFFNPVLKLEDVDVRLHTFPLKYIQTFAMWGKTARVDIGQAYQRGRWKGLLDGEAASTERSGWSDLFVRFSMNLVGAPPLRGKDFAAYRAKTPRETLVGVALGVQLPTGKYYSDKLINLGLNRYVFRPQLGAVHNNGKWSFELTGSTWIYTDNNNFFGGSRLENDVLYTVQGYVVYSFRPGLWLGTGAGYGYGAESTVDGTSKGDERENLAWGANMGYPITRQLGVKVGYIGTRTQNSLGADTDTVVGALAFLW